MAGKDSVKSIRLADGSILKLECVDSVESVAALAKSYANSGYANKYVVFTEHQTGPCPIKAAGDSTHGIYMSCILNPSFFPSQAGLLAPLATVAMLNALEEHTDKELGIGWLSDVYCNNKKIGNVSIEGKLDSFSSYEYMIVSFYVALDESNFPPRLGDMIKKVFEPGNDSIAMIIAKTILHKFFAAYASLKNPKKYMDTYARRFILTDKKIKYIKDGKKHSCRVVGIDKDTCSMTVDIGRGELLKITSPSSVVIPNRIHR